MLRRAEMTERFPVLCQEPGSPRLPAAPLTAPLSAPDTQSHPLACAAPGRSHSPAACPGQPPFLPSPLAALARWMCHRSPHTELSSWAAPERVGSVWGSGAAAGPMEPCGAGSRARALCLVRGTSHSPTQLSPRRARSRGLESQGPARSPQRSPKALGAHGLGAVPGALPIFCFLTRFSARPE